MLRRRLALALAGLAAAAVLEGVAAVWALGVADHHVRQGRVASDIQLGFVELSAAKQRLRTWLSQSQLDAGALPAEREALQTQMRTTLARLGELSREAVRLDTAGTARPEALQRQDALAVLGLSLQQLDRAVDAAQPLPPGADAQRAWQALSAVFDVTQGRDLRSLLAESIARESAAVARERAAADTTLRWMRALWLGAALTLALAALLLAAHFTRALSRPLQRLNQGAQALQQGDLSHRIVAEGRDEFSAVAHSVNAMAAELQLHRQREAQARQRLEDLVHARTAELQGALQTLQQLDARRRQLFADISHELRTPTTAIRGEAEIALRGRDKPAEDYKFTLQRIVGTSRQLAMVIDDLLTMARSDIDALSLDRQPLDLAEPLAEALAQARVLAQERQIEIQAPALPAGSLPMWGDAQRLRQLVSLLLDNALRYSHPGGRVRLELLHGATDAGSAAAAGGDRCELRISDQGIGIPAHELPQVFERNFRGERARQHRADGTGLGLSIGAALARAHGGDIHIDSTTAPGQPGGTGTTVRLRLPLHRPLHPAPGAPATADLPTAGSGTA